MKQTVSSCVQVGSVVTVRETGWDDEQQFHIVLPHETSMGSERISSSSPFGQAILNAVLGALVTVAAPAGDIQFEVVAIA